MYSGIPIENCFVEETAKEVMPQEQEGSIRRRRHLDRSAGDTDDRGWTPLHTCARNGDFKEVCFQVSDNLA